MTPPAPPGLGPVKSAWSRCCPATFWKMAWTGMATAAYMARRKTFNNFTWRRMVQVHFFEPQLRFGPVFFSWLAFNATLYPLLEPVVALCTRNRATLAYFYYPNSAGAGVVLEVEGAKVIRFDWHRFKLWSTPTRSNGGHVATYANMPHIDWDVRAFVDAPDTKPWARVNHFPWRQLFHNRRQASRTRGGARSRTGGGRAAKRR